MTGSWVLVCGNTNNELTGSMKWGKAMELYELVDPTFAAWVHCAFAIETLDAVLLETLPRCNQQLPASATCIWGDCPTKQALHIVISLTSLMHTLVSLFQAEDDYIHLNKQVQQSTQLLRMMHPRQKRLFRWFRYDFDVSSTVVSSQLIVGPGKPILNLSPRQKLPDVIR